MKSAIIIDRQEIAAMTSPVKFLLNHVRKTIDILPEKVKREFAEMEKLSLHFINSNKFICDVNVETKTIRLSVRVVEVFWVSSYVSGIYYDIAEGKSALEGSGGVEVIHREHPELCIAMKLYEWLINEWLNPNAPQPWPDNLPFPRSCDLRGSSEWIASERTVHCVGYLVLHEIAHVALNHAPTPKAASIPSQIVNSDSSRGDFCDLMIASINQEKEADQQAITWLLVGRGDPNSDEYTKLGISVCIANGTKIRAKMDKNAVL